MSRPLNKSTRHGKIARLPLELREQLNQRLRNGECGRHLVAWLNELPEVRAVLVAHFGGRAINEPNLTAWRQNGYREWLMECEARALAERLGRQATLETVENPTPMTETLAHWVASRYAVATVRVEGAESPEEHWRLLREMSADVARLRHGDLAQQRLDLEHQRAELKLERAEIFTGRKGFLSQNRPTSETVK